MSICAVRYTFVSEEATQRTHSVAAGVLVLPISDVIPACVSVSIYALHALGDSLHNAFDDDPAVLGEG